VNLFVIKMLGQAMMLHKHTYVEGSIYTHTNTCIITYMYKQVNIHLT